MSDRPGGRDVVPVLVLSIAGISWAGTLVRLCDDLHPVAIGAWRLGLSALVLLPWAMARRAPVGLRGWGLVVVSGALLAGHFWTWFVSLSHTSVVRSTLLVCLSPLWAGVIETLLGQRLGARAWLGMAVAILGVAIMAGATGEGDPRGDLLAIAAGWMSASYFVIARSLRRTLPIAQLGVLVYGATAAWLSGVAVALGAAAWPGDPGTWGALAGLVAGPQLLGHLGLAYAMAWLPASVVASTVLLEPMGAALVAWGVLGEAPTWRDALGGGVAIGGVLLATKR